MQDTWQLPLGTQTTWSCWTNSQRPATTNPSWQKAWALLAAYRLHGQLPGLQHAQGGQVGCVLRHGPLGVRHAGVPLPSHAGVCAGPLHRPGTAGGVCVHRADRRFPAEHATAPSEGHQASDELARLRQRPGRVDEGAWDRHATGTAGRPQAGYDVRA